MRAGGGKQKGASYERKVCVLLSLWLTRGAQEDLFWRSAMSGGRSTVSYAKGKRLASQAGDISSIHKLGNAFIDRFLIECKAYRDLEFEKLVKGTGHLLAFWREASLQSSNYDKIPLLIAKQNQYPEVICMDRIGMREFSLTTQRLVLTAPQVDLHVMLLADFLKLRPWKRRG